MHLWKREGGGMAALAETWNKPYHSLNISTTWNPEDRWSRSLRISGNLSTCQASDPGNAALAASRNLECDPPCKTKNRAGWDHAKKSRRGKFPCFKYRSVTEAAQGKKKQKKKEILSHCQLSVLSSFTRQVFIVFFFLSKCTPRHLWKSGDSLF